MLYLCIPAYNEAQTVGLLIWRIRKVLQEQPREYEVLIYDDGSCLLYTSPSPRDS